MKRWALTAMLCAAQAHGDDSVALNLRAQFESYGGQGALERSVQAVDLRWQLEAPLQNTLRGVFTARHASDAPSELVVNELSLDRPLGTGFATIGKKVMSWDVGYAFRPIDVVQQEDRRAVAPLVLEGVPMLAWEWFDAERALTLVWSNPGHGRAAQPRDDSALALRLYKRRGARDEYAVLRLSQRNGAEAGVAFSQVAGEALELHASLLWQQRHDAWVPDRWLPADGGGKAMAGMTWTTEGKLSLLAEAWIDRSQYLSTQRRNLLLRAAQTLDDVEVSGDLLWMPDSGARIASAAISWRPGAWLLSATLRRYGGTLPARSAAVATLQHAF